MVGAMVASDEASLLLYCSATPPDLVVLDSDYSGPVIEIARALKEKHPEMRLVVVAEHFDLDLVRQGYAARVDSFCSSASGRDVLIRSLELVMLGEAVLPTAVALAALNRFSVSLVDTLQESATEIEPDVPN